jgi:hypothetical protein
VEFGELDRACWKGTARGDQSVGVVEQSEMFDIAGDAAVVEHQVNLADGWRVGFVLEQPDVAVGVVFAQLADDTWQEEVGHALDGADVDTSVAGSEPVEGDGHGLGLLQQLTAVGEHDRAERGDPYRLRSAGPVEDRATYGSFQYGDVLAHCRLGVAEPGRRAIERALIGDGGHGGQVPQFNLGHASRIPR